MQLKFADNVICFWCAQLKKVIRCQIRAARRRIHQFFCLSQWPTVRFIIQESFDSPNFSRERRNTTVATWPLMPKKRAICFDVLFFRERRLQVKDSSMHCSEGQKYKSTPRFSDKKILFSHYRVKNTCWLRLSSISIPKKMLISSLTIQELYRRSDFLLTQK